MKHEAQIGIFGGSGFYEFLTDKAKQITLDTPYGAPSDEITLVEIEGRKVAFLPRHGKNHQYPPHMINYQANLYAMKMLGVKYIIGPCAVGSLQAHLKPGDFLVCDQFVNRTYGRADTFYDGPITTHVSSADPYCPQLRKIAITCAEEMEFPIHKQGTVVVIQGPRFSTRAESKEFNQHGWDIVNMTQYPEVYLARELEMCYVNISVITDYDSGLEGNPSIKAVSHDEVVKVFSEKMVTLKTWLVKMIEKIPVTQKCICSSALKASGRER